MDCERFTKLRSALVALVGVDGKKDLEDMRDYLIQNTPDCEEKRVSLLAVNTLLETLPCEANEK